jgi:hypothetical protein
MDVYTAGSLQNVNLTDSDPALIRSKNRDKVCPSSGGNDTQICRVRSLWFKCTLEACVKSENGTCTEGREGPACGTCMAGYALSANKCRACGETSFELRIFFFALVGT